MGFFDDLKRKVSDVADSAMDMAGAAADKCELNRPHSSKDGDDDLTDPDASLAEDLLTMEELAKVLRDSGLEEEACSVERDIESIREGAKATKGRGGVGAAVEDRDAICARINELKKEAVDKGGHEGKEGGGEEVEALWKEVRVPPPTVRSNNTLNPGRYSKQSKTTAPCNNSAVNLAR